MAQLSAANARAMAFAARTVRHHSAIASASRAAAAAAAAVRGDADGDDDGNGAAVGGYDDESDHKNDQKRQHPPRSEQPQPPARYGHKRLQRQRKRAKAMGLRASGKPLDDSKRKMMLIDIQSEVDEGYDPTKAIGRAATKYGAWKQTPVQLTTAPAIRTTDSNAAAAAAMQERQLLHSVVHWTCDSICKWHRFCSNSLLTAACSRGEPKRGAKSGWNSNFFP